MNIKIIIASIIVAIVLSAISFFIGLYNLFPGPLAVFSVALLAGCFTSYWVCSAEGLTQGSNSSRKSSSRKKHRKSKKESKPVVISAGPRETGSVKWFSASKGFGFITRDSGDDIFVHFRSIVGDGHRILREGQRVNFAVTEGDKGLQAEEVDAEK